MTYSLSNKCAKNIVNCQFNSIYHRRRGHVFLEHCVYLININIINISNFILFTLTCKFYV